MRDGNGTGFGGSQKLQRLEAAVRVIYQNLEAGKLCATLRSATPKEAGMSLSVCRFTFICFVLIALIPLEAATVSRESANVFAVKMALIQRQGATIERVGALRTLVTEDELNSWFMYSAQPLLPDGLGQPQITIVGAGRLAGQAIVDLDAVARQRSTGVTR